jgi:hypothetical protein
MLQIRRDSNGGLVIEATVDLETIRSGNSLSARDLAAHRLE